MSVITNNTIQPSSGQPLTIKDEGGTASITVATNGEATFAENIKVTANKGINFSAYATSGNPSSNLLDDYEEGTWTIATNSHNGFGASVNPDGTPRYIKIGNQVTVMAGWYQEGNTGNVVKGDYFAVQGWPFAFSADSFRSASFCVSFNYNTSNSALFRAVPNSTTSLFMTVTSLLGSTGIRAGGRIQLVGTYFT